MPLNYHPILSYGRISDRFGHYTLLATFDKLTIDPALESQLAHDSSSSSDINMSSVSTGGAPASSDLFLGLAGATGILGLIIALLCLNS